MEAETGPRPPGVPTCEDPEHRGGPRERTVPDGTGSLLATLESEGPEDGVIERSRAFQILHGDRDVVQHGSGSGRAGYAFRASRWTTSVSSAGIAGPYTTT